MKYFPINIDISKFRTVVIGGGEVATRKVKNLIEFSAKPVVIAPEITNELLEIIDLENLTYIQRKYRKGDLNEFELVFVATDDENLDNEIVEEIQNHLVLVNFADKPDKSNFIMPSFVRRGNLLIAISTQGSAPFLSRHIRECLEKKLPDDFNDFMELSILFRSMMIQSKIPTKQEIIEEYFSVDWLKIIREEGFDYATELVKNLVRKYAKE